MFHVETTAQAKPEAAKHRGLNQDAENSKFPVEQEEGQGRELFLLQKSRLQNSFRIPEVGPQESTSE